jgi:hypothetical protein
MKEEIKVYCPKIEDFDYVVYDLVNEDLNIFADTQTGWRKVPVIFASPEAFVSSKEDFDARDQNGTLNYPIISIEKKSVSKPNAHDGNMAVNQFNAPDYKGGAIQIAQKISQFSNSKFKNKNSYNETGYKNRKHTPKKGENDIYQIISMPQPSFIEIKYEILVVSNFHQQLNQIISPFITRYGNINYFSKTRNEWSYELFIQEQFSQESNVADFSTEERLFKSKMEIVVKGYILEKENSDYANITIRETPIEFKFKKEYVLKGSIEEYLSNPNKFKVTFEKNPIVIFDAKIDDFNNSSNIIPITMAISGSTLYIGGSFTYVNGEKRNRLAALNKYTGKLLSFNPDINTVSSGICSVNTIVFSGTNMYVGGNFLSSSGQSRGNVACYDSESGQIKPWNPNTSGVVNTISSYGNNIYIGGSFTSISGSTRNRLAVVDKTTGALGSENPNMSALVLAGIIDNNFYYVGGTFTTVGGVSRNRLAAFSLPSFSLATWNPNASVSARPLLASGSYIYVGGNYTTLNGISVKTICQTDKTTGTPNVINTFTSGNGSRNAIAYGNDIFVVGDFSYSNAGKTRSNFAAFDSTTITLDNTYKYDSDLQIYNIIIDEGSIYLCGGFSTINGQPRYGIFKGIIS